MIKVERDHFEAYLSCYIILVSCGLFGGNYLHFRRTGDVSIPFSDAYVVTLGSFMRQFGGGSANENCLLNGSFIIIIQYGKNLENIHCMRPSFVITSWYAQIFRFVTGQYIYVVKSRGLDTGTFVFLMNRSRSKNHQHLSALSAVA